MCQDPFAARGGPVLSSVSRLNVSSLFAPGGTIPLTLNQRGRSSDSYSTHLFFNHFEPLEFGALKPFGSLLSKYSH